jgi:hypothetical protein
MAKMIRLDPAPKEALPGEGWELIATEAGRYPNGLRATLQIWNGKLQGAQQLALAQPQSWSDFATAVAAQTGATAEEIMKRILALIAGVEGVLREVEAQVESRGMSQATELVGIAADAELFHSPDGEAFATITVDDHQETWLIKAKGFRRWLARQFYQAHEKAPGSQAVQDALGVLEGKALFDGPEYAVFTRLAELDGVIYLDLANERWEAVEITTSAWRVIATPPVKFRRARGMLPLPCPVHGGSLDELRGLLNIADDRDWILVKAWLVKTRRPSGPHPVLTLHGEQGSAKSTTSRILRVIIDPNTAALRAEPRDGRDLIIAATNGWIISLDNLSHLSPWLSDAICRLATGGGFATRELYSDAEEALFDAQRPVILNGIEELATRGDLLDRCIILYLPAIPEEKRKSEAELWRDFEAKRPAILGALLDAVSKALRGVGTVKIDRLPRMADFALWAVAAAPNLGYTSEELLAAYSSNRSGANELTLEASVVTPFMKHMATKGFVGTSTELIQHLNDQATDDLKRQKQWPQDGRTLSNALRRISPNLRAIGVNVDFERQGKRRTRTITISTTAEPEQNNKPSSAASASSATHNNDKQINEIQADDKADANWKADASAASTTTHADAGGPTADDRRTQAQSPVTHGNIRPSDAADAADEEKHTHSSLICAGCRDPFTPGHGGATMTLCSGCAAELKRKG